MLKIGGWIVSLEAAENWMRAHPECGVPPGQFVELSLENFVQKRFGRQRGTGRIHRLTWPKVRPKLRFGSGP